MSLPRPKIHTIQYPITPQRVAEIDFNFEAVCQDARLQAQRLQWGTGSPQGVLAAPVGTLFLRTDGSTGTVLYVKETGSDVTGWVAK